MAFQIFKLLLRYTLPINPIEYQYKLKRCSNKECCKQCRYVTLKGTLTRNTCEYRNLSNVTLSTTLNLKASTTTKDNKWEDTLVRSRLKHTITINISIDTTIPYLMHRGQHSKIFCQIVFDRIKLMRFCSTPTESHFHFFASSYETSF